MPEYATNFPLISALKTMEVIRKILRREAGFLQLSKDVKTLMGFLGVGSGAHPGTSHC